MKVAKRAMALIMAVVMLMSLLVTTASAVESNITAEVSNSNPKVGDTIVVTVSNKKNDCKVFFC